MGKKKNKLAKKGKGCEKTALKTEKKADKKAKKSLAEKGEEDIESIIAEIAEADKRLLKISEIHVSPPTPRSSMTLTNHPDTDDMYIFGGEYFNGQRVTMYNDLLRYNTKKNEWYQIKSPNAPPPRCSHQTVFIPHSGGELWIFGGEFTSPTESQFYHYKDLWCYHIQSRQWESVKAPGAPSSRSGHRMVNVKRDLIVFGGFHDRGRDYKYFNDVHLFSLETRSWAKLEVVGTAPGPRSACQFLPTSKGHVLVYGGFSKVPVKRDVDKGTTHADMFLLVHDNKTNRWRWQSVKQSGVKPPERCSLSMASWVGDRAVMFGGVSDAQQDSDEDSDDDEINRSTCLNDLYLLDVVKSKWFELELKGVTTRKSKRRRKEKCGMEEEGVEMEESSEDEEEDMEADNVRVEQLNLQDKSVEEKKEDEENVFKVVVAAAAGPSASRTLVSHTVTQTSGSTSQPCGRMNACVCVKSNVLYVYGGLVERGDKQYTLNDMYSLDLKRLDEWRVVIPLDEKVVSEWCGSSSEEDDDDEEEEEEEEEEVEDNDEVEDDDEEEEDDDDCKDEDTNIDNNEQRQGDAMETMQVP